MKNLVLSLVCLFVLSNLVRANGTDIVVSGSLLDDINLNGRINKMIFTENKTEIRLDNEYVEAESCEGGSFKIAKTENGTYRLKSIISCEKFVDEPSAVEACPENFQPVCGEISFEDFGKALPQVITFPNVCELYRAKAVYLKSGSCAN